MVGGVLEAEQQPALRAAARDRGQATHLSLEGHPWRCGGMPRVLRE